MTNFGYPVVIYDLHPQSEQRRLHIVVRRNHSVATVLKNVKTQYNYESFDLLYQPKNLNYPVTRLNFENELLFIDIPGFEETRENILLMLPPNKWSGDPNQRLDYTTEEMNESSDNDNSPVFSENDVELSAQEYSDDDLALGASASPTNIGVNEDTCEENLVLDEIETGFANTESNFQLNRFLSSEVEETANMSDSPPQLEADERHYVGLVNQAMTCYLNSLLQALFMTPEFRNALYAYKFDEQDETNSIPYQLQKLFVNLQTSSRSSVETTALTRSFGWDSYEIWQQHDVQELCRVLFEALEVKFKNTKHAELISKLYEGKMTDVIRCLECNTAKIKVDSFLDIALPVRQSDSKAYQSIEEALQAFSQFELLEGSNQYFCENCNKKCDAHKGLKFKKFPYILTLHLKRFDFHRTFHRVKLSDRVSFPYNLNLNEYIFPNKSPTGTSSASEDSRTTDSAMSMNEDTQSTASSNQPESSRLIDDEGIDETMSTGTINANTGPYNYELFAVMIHSGSANGGHYYAYIKDLETNEWLSFNDRIVSKLHESEIEKTFGSTNSYSISSTCAYMLMYRQIDAKRNELPMGADDFPEHIKLLVHALHAEETQRSSRPYLTINFPNISTIQTPIRVHFYDPTFQKLISKRLTVASGSDYTTMLKSVHEFLGIERYAAVERCRLVAFDPINDKFLQSFEDESKLVEHSLSVNRANYFIEIRREDQEFLPYSGSGTTWRVYKVSMEAVAIEGPYMVYTESAEINDIKHSVAVNLNLNEESIIINLTAVNFKKAFVACCSQPTKELEEELDYLVRSKLKLLNFYYLNVPDVTPAALHKLNIPVQNIRDEICGSDVVDAALIKPAKSIPTTSEETSKCRISDEIFNSHIYEASSAFSNENNSDGLSFGKLSSNRSKKFMFYAQKLDGIAAVGNAGTSPSDWDTSSQKPETAYKIYACKSMKINELKQYVSELIGVPVNYFQLLKNRKSSLECEMDETLYCFDEGETLTVNIGKLLELGEYRAKVHLLEFPDFFTDSKSLDRSVECVCRNDMSVTEAKGLIVDKLRSLDDRCKDLTIENCRFWVNVGEGIAVLNKLPTEGSDCEFFIEKCFNPEVFEGRLIFTSSWNADSKQIETFRVINALNNNHDDIVNALAYATEIPAEYLLLIRSNVLTYEKLELNNLESSEEWKKANELNINLVGGDIFICRDTRAENKNGSHDERKQTTSKYFTYSEPNSSSSLSRRNDKSLKISIK